MSFDALSKSFIRKIAPSRAADFVLVSQKSRFLETEVSRLASNRLSNDHVIKEVDLQNSCPRGDSFGESQIRIGRTHGARGVVVHQCETERRMRDWRPQDFSRVRNGFVHGALGNVYPGDATELGI